MGFLYFTLVLAFIYSTKNEDAIPWRDKGSRFVITKTVNNLDQLRFWETAHLPLP